MRSEGEDGTGLDMCSEWRGTMTAWWRCGNLQEKGKWADQRSHGEEQRKSEDRRGEPAGPKSGAWHKTGMVGE